MSQSELDIAVKKARSLSRGGGAIVYSGSEPPASYLGNDLAYAAGATDLPSSTHVNVLTNLKLRGNFELYDDNYGISGSLGYGYTRRPQNSVPLNALQNTWFATRTGAYTVISPYGSVGVYRNGTLVQTTQAPFGSFNLSTTVGDRIFTTKPVMFSNTTYPGVIPAYAGWMGMCFAHRVDRYGGNKTLYMFTLDNNTKIEVRYTTTDDAEVGSMTQDYTTTLVNYYSYATRVLQSTRNYYIFSDKPICCYVDGDTEDTMPLYPMTPGGSRGSGANTYNGALYGYFSGDGHTHIAPNWKEVKEGSQTAFVVKALTSAGGVSTIAQRTPTSNMPYAYTDTASPQTSGTLFSGNAIKIFADSGDPLIAAESQGDSNGGEMTPFVCPKAFGVLAVMANSADWCAAVSTYNSNFADTQLFFHQASTGYIKAFAAMTGNDSTGVGKVRFTNLVKGDFIRSVTYNSEHLVGTTFQAYYDTSTSTDDETVIYMSDGGDLPNDIWPVDVWTNIQETTAADACALRSQYTPIQAYAKFTAKGIDYSDGTFPALTQAVGIDLYSNSAGTTSLTVTDDWFVIRSSIHGGPDYAVSQQAGSPTYRVDGLAICR